MATRVIERTSELAKTNEALHVENAARKLAEEGLWEKTALLEAYLDCAFDGILIVSPEGMQVFKNERFNEIWRIPQHAANDPADVAGKSRGRPGSICRRRHEWGWQDRPGRID